MNFSFHPEAEEEFIEAVAYYENTNRKALLDRIVAMLTKLGQRGYAVHEDRAEYTGQNDPDPDTEGNQDQADRQPEAGGYRRWRAEA
ncbi:MAG: hypothetical protein RBS99_19275 [Rhodospirillales bacterium]|jgi:hypothetical protein|nr:hypothetical protein [Rhodospirillales bacterium]